MVKVDLSDSENRLKLKTAGVQWRMEDMTKGYVEIDAETAKRANLDKATLKHEEKSAEKHEKAVAKDQKEADGRIKDITKQANKEREAEEAEKRKAAEEARKADEAAARAAGRAPPPR